MQTLTINQREYPLDDLPPEARALLLRMHSAQSEIERLETLLSTYQKIRSDAYEQLVEVMNRT